MSDYASWYWYWWYDWKPSKGNKRPAPLDAPDRGSRCVKRMVRKTDPTTGIGTSKPNPQGPHSPVRTFTQAEYDANLNVIEGTQAEYWVWCEGKKCPGGACQFEEIYVSLLLNDHYQNDFKCKCVPGPAKAKQKAPANRSGVKKKKPNDQAPPDSEAPKK